MRTDRKRNLAFLACIIAVLLVTILSRSAGLTYNLSIHPDESEFYNGSASLAASILDPDVPFVEEKEYPEGAYILQLPFQLMRIFLGSSHWFWRSSHCWNRIASLFYFVLAMIYGVMILTRFMSRSRVAAVLYAVTMCFSLFFIEHSRYGVGDMGSLWLLMVIIYHCACALRTKKTFHLLLAAFCAGVMGAVKYPQIFFLLIPLGTCLRRNDQSKGRKALTVMALVLFALAAFLMFSPKAAQDPAYILRVISREGDAYLGEDIGVGGEGVLNHILSTVLYGLFYSDFPLSFLFVAAYFYRALRNRTGEEETDYLFHKLLPVMAIVFFAYNMFVSLLVFRTLTPLLGMTALYSAEAAGALAVHRDTRGRCPGRKLVLLLTCLMVLRGGWLLLITGQQGDEKDRFTSILSENLDENWNKVTLLELYNVATEYSFGDYLVCPEELSVTEMDLTSYEEKNNGLTLAPGELVITGAYDYWLAAPYIVPVEKSATEELWQEFKTENQAYYVGQLYPSTYYYLFGSWLRGGTLGQFMMPCNMVYYRST